MSIPLPPPVRSQDQEHLRLLKTFHYVVGGLIAFFSCFALIYLVLGIMFLSSPETFKDSNTGQPAPAFLGGLFVGLGSVFFVLGEVLAVCIFIAGKYIGQRRRYMFVFIVACLECLFMPFGTILGVFTIMVLSRDSVKRLFEENSQPVA